MSMHYEDILILYHVYFKRLITKNDKKYKF